MHSEIERFEFIPKPHYTYYKNIRNRVVDVLTEKLMEEYEKLGILVDGDDQICSSWNLQKRSLKKKLGKVTCHQIYTWKLPKVSYHHGNLYKECRDSLEEIQPSNE